MAKKKQARGTGEERLIFCSGPNWAGDGSKDSSACRFGKSMQSTAERYKCNGCVTGQTPEEVYAGPNGIRKSEFKDALKEEQVFQINEPEPVVEEPVEVAEAVVEKPVPVSVDPNTGFPRQVTAATATNCSPSEVVDLTATVEPEKKAAKPAPKKRKKRQRF